LKRKIREAFERIPKGAIDRIYTLKLSPQEQLEVAFGLENLNPPEIRAAE
jgi:hypothetical protein